VEPDTLAALGYDAAGLLASAIENTSSLAPDEVAQTLETMEYEGVTGRWTFDAQHNPLKPVVLYRIEGEGGTFHSAVRP
jgi:branched-chain amino acid transport system substrate-binding protein